MAEPAQNLVERLKTKIEADAVEILHVLRQSINDCVTGEEYSGERREALDNMVRQTHEYKGLSQRWYQYGKGAVIRDDNPQFRLMNKLGFIDGMKGSRVAPQIRGCFPGLNQPISISSILSGPHYFFLSQEAVDFYLAAEREKH